MATQAGKAAAKQAAEKLKQLAGMTPHIVTEADVKANPELAAAGHLKVGDEVMIPSEEADMVPTFTLRADSKGGIKAMIAIAQTAASFSIDEQEQIHTAMREFELYEEAVRLEAAQS